MLPQENALNDLRAHVADLTQRLASEADGRAVDQRRAELLEKEVEASREKAAALLQTVERNKEVGII